jgi:hypothetical protein
VGSTGFIAYVFFSGPLLDLYFLKLLIIIVNCPFVKADGFVKSSNSPSKKQRDKKGVQIL